MSRRITVSIFLSCLFLTGLAHAGVLVSRTDAGLQFTEAVSLSINGKDKILDLGAAPKASATTAKLPSIKLGEPILKDSTGAPALYSEGRFTYFLPEGLPKNSTVKPAEAWSSAHITYKKSASEKTPQEIPAASVVAFLPGGVEELAHLCNDKVALAHIAGPDKIFPAQMELMAAAVRTYSADPALGPLQRYVEQSMRSRYEEFEAGLGAAVLLDEALKLVELSKAVYPNQPDQEKLRQEILARKAWLDRKLAILRTFAAGSEWDTFLVGDKPFEKYEPAFPEIGALRIKALQLSMEMHKQAGEDLLKDREYEAAVREFRLAGLRQPSDRLLQQKAMIAWTNYSGEVAAETKRARKPLGSGEREILNQAIQFATNYNNEKKLDLALKSILEAENVDPDSLPMLLKKAEILGARKDFSGALTALDRYDLNSVDEERDKGSNLRNDLMFRRTSTLEDIRAQLQKAWQAGNYHSIRDLTLRGLQAKNDDADLLYQAGKVARITRDYKLSYDYFNRYLDISNTLDADAKQRVQVRQMLAAAQVASRPEEGTPNWLSGKKLPPNVYYCPVSLAFQPKIERIDASGKMKVNFQWDGDRLVSIAPLFEKAEHATGERSIGFAYDPTFPQVSMAVDGASRPPAPSSSDPDELVRNSSLVILNNPYIDPDAVQKLTGRDITLGIAGNRYFLPFVWEKLHYFRFTYDLNGRVSEAREIASAAGPPTGFTLKFEWLGQQLTAVHGFQGGVKMYDRTIDYQDGRIVGEDIQGEGKNSKIKYNYNGGRLISATCSTDKSLDGRSRQVMFR